MPFYNARRSQVMLDLASKMIKWQQWMQRTNFWSLWCKWLYIPILWFTSTFYATLLSNTQWLQRFVCFISCCNIHFCYNCDICNAMVRNFLCMSFTENTSCLICQLRQYANRTMVRSFSLALISSSLSFSLTLSLMRFVGLNFLSDSELVWTPLACWLPYDPDCCCCF